MLDEPRYRLLWLCLCWSCVSGCGEADSEPSQTAPAHPDMLRVRDGEIVDGHGDRALLSGVDFYNGVDFVKGALGGPPPEADHAEIDFERVREMGMNTATFAMSYHWFEDGDAPFRSRERGFEFIDKNLEWAAEHGVRLILQLSEYPGAEFVDGCGKPGLFETSEHQNRVAELWQLIASRYKDDPSVAAYDLLLHPSPNASLDQWAKLAERLIGVVRAVDPHHLILIERAPVIACNYGLPVEEAFANVSDANLAYSAHFNWPYEYTGQGLAGSVSDDGGTYPDSTLPAINWDYMKWEAWSLDSRPSAQALRLPAGDSEWTEQRFTYTVTDPDYQIAQIAFTSHRNSSETTRGTAYFDDLTVKEYDEKGKLLRTLFDVDLESCEGDGCYLYEGIGNTEVKATGEKGTSPEHHRGEASVTLSNTTTAANITLGHLFPVTLGHTYEVRGWVKGDDLQPDSETFIVIDFFSYSAELDLRTRDTLRRQLQAYYDVAREFDVPLVTGFGIGRPAFEDDKGGLRWVEDVLDFVIEQRGHFSYNGYHDDEYGIYGGSGELPEADDVNQPLVELFSEKLLDSKREP